MVAIVAIVGTRLESRDLRKRLERDVAVMLKLDEDSRARRILEMHIAEVARRIAHMDHARWVFRGTAIFTSLAWVALVAAGALDVLSSGDVAKLSRFGSMLTHVFSGFAALCLILAAVFMWRVVKPAKLWVAKFDKFELFDDSGPSAAGDDKTK